MASTRESLECRVALLTPSPFPIEPQLFGLLCRPVSTKMFLQMHFKAKFPGVRGVMGHMIGLTLDVVVRT